MFKLEEFAGKRVYSSLLQDEGLVAFFTTRDLPLKTGERDDLIDQVENNKKLVCKELNIPLENLIIPQQTHSDNVAVVKVNRERSSEILITQSLSHLVTYENTDALITDQCEIALALNFADCVPILFYDPVKKIIAAAHAGWRGTATQIAPKTVQKMIEEFGCRPSNIFAAIGPAIGKCCFEAQEDVLKQLAQSMNFTFNAGGLGNPPYLNEHVSTAISDNHADLKLINKLQLLACGLEKIDVCGYCTSCKNELFFSYRKEKGNTARHSAVIMVNGKQ